MTDPRLAETRAHLSLDLAFLLHKISTLGGTLTGCIVGMDSIDIYWDNAEDEVA